MFKLLLTCVSNDQKLFINIICTRMFHWTWQGKITKWRNTITQIQMQNFHTLFFHPSFLILSLSGFRLNIIFIFYVSIFLDTSWKKQWLILYTIKWYWGNTRNMVRKMTINNYLFKQKIERQKFAFKAFNQE